ncbi:MAG: hypothetical protein EPO40_16440 [Myxococcaceae bacterium]|nr:MAG: hypothetical protein EPO40_16440 [Myxococcaceae bacterium]
MLLRRRSDDDGIRFINHRARRQWDAAQKLVAVLDEPDVIATVEALGGKRHLKALRKAHHEFGAGHGFSQAKELAPEVTTSTRAEQLALQAALRDYLVKVSTRVSRRKPESAALARFLLEPYAEMVDDLERSACRTTKKAAAPADPAGPDGLTQATASRTLEEGSRHGCDRRPHPRRGSDGRSRPCREP